MLCENCRKERELGQEYWFHYGNKVLETEKFDIDKLATFRNTLYLIKGEMSAWICKRCSNTQFRVYLGGYIALSAIGVLVLLGLAFDAAGGTQALLGGLVCVGLPWLGLGILLLLRREKINNSFGEAHALRIKKDTLKHQGFDAFFNSVEYHRLKQNR